MENENLNLYSQIFILNDEAVAFLLDQGIIEREIPCSYCGSLMSIRRSATATNGHIYRCRNSSCNKRRSILAGCIFKSPKILLHLFLRALFCFIMSMDNTQSTNTVEISEPTYIKIKKRFIGLMKKDLDSNDFMMGVNGTAVHVDETAVRRGRIITNPTSCCDSIPNVTWLVGVIEEAPEQRVVLRIVPDRRVATLKSFLESVIVPGTTVKLMDFLLTQGL